MELRLDFASSDSEAGFRLAYFEFYNWGTFNKTIVSLKLNSKNGLLTGDIGSGKSTIVDALTTLLVPHNKIIYNKAAGASTKERSLYSYILGEYKSSQDEHFGNAKAVTLRDSSNFSVLLAKFENDGFGESITLAQFFYLVNNQPQKFFVVSRGKLGIKKDFFNFNDVRELRKRLKSLEHTEVFDTFKDYSRVFCRAMGIKNEQALNLFYQTVSLKSIGNLTDFIRSHMLESNNIETQIDNLCSNFADLNHTHELILRAKDQIELLKPIEINGKKYHLLQENQSENELLKERLSLFFAHKKTALLENKIKELRLELQKKESLKKALGESVDKINSDLMELNMELRKNGGDRIESIKKEIESLGKHLSSAKIQNQKYNEIIKSLGFQAVSNEHRFLITKEEMGKDLESIEKQKNTLEGEIYRDKVSKENYKKELIELQEEIAYLQNSPSNIPTKSSRIRQEIAKFLGVSNDKLPFVGELISVKDEKWSGAIERVLHNFALSLIVDDDYYKGVSEYVDRNHLDGKLVYLRVDSKKEYAKEGENVKNSILEKLEIKRDTPFAWWLQSELVSRFNVPCVVNMDEFRRYKKALTINGQFKSSFSRHEKDDRFSIDNKSHWVLGWDNFIKLQALQNKAQSIKEKVDFIENSLLQNFTMKEQIEKRRDAIIIGLEYDNFEDIDWYKYSKEIENLEEEQKKLELSSDILSQLQESIREKKILQNNLKSKYEAAIEESSRILTNLETKEEELGNNKTLINNHSIEDWVLEKLQRFLNELTEGNLNLVNIGSSQKRIEDSLGAELKDIAAKIQKLGEKIVKDMGKYSINYPAESKDFDSSLDSLVEFQKRLKTLEKDNLPKWEKKFKTLLKEKTIQSIVSLQATLEENSKAIASKIQNINHSLRDIEYNEGTYIELLAAKSNISDIKSFKESLKSSISGAIDGDNNYDEQKFLQIKSIIARFNGREGYVDIDKKWRKLVTDVRNWFDFSASEKYMSDGVQKEYYAHSGGKSGGQKEKLAYTVLASSLAYQFGLEYDKIQSRSFRFVMIDEAFGRGSDESTRYALRLFEKLKLQLLVITPKQKINVIEPFVSSVHFVHNKDGMDSTLLGMEIKEYQENKKTLK